MTRKVVGVEIEGDPMIGYIEDYLMVMEGEARIGQVSSAFYSPRLKKNIGYALVPIEHAELGSSLTVRSAVGETKATVVRKPFIDPKKSTPKK
ncbi:MAG: hypothetical protein H0U17_11370 [Actinobacteria bacterium]|nr:hypothetical protein [Actinomycetota bacterium]